MVLSIIRKPSVTVKLALDVIYNLIEYLYAFHLFCLK
jgi:hypothetical protein